MSAATAHIWLHDILNRPATPAQVFRHILIHELIHLTVEPREVDQKVTDHPPEFWEIERRLSPERKQVWHWIWFQCWSLSATGKDGRTCDPSYPGMR
jgi:predicted metal-dependent hydrolase